MMIPEEHRDVILLTAVTLLSAVVVASLSLVDAPARSADQKQVTLADTAPVRVIGPQFVPNTNPRER